MRLRGFLLAPLLPALLLCRSATAELPAEPVPHVAKVPVPYAPHWVLIHDFAFGNLIDSKFVLADADSGLFLGMVSAGQFATANISAQRREIYIGETYHARGTRGPRSDFVTVYDMENLAVVKEIEIPPRRANIVINKSNTALLDDEKFLVVFNLNPATSVSVVDLEARSFVGEVAAPGCSMVYSAGNRRFFMLCGDGTLMSVTLDDQGAVAARKKSAPFIDIDVDPLSEKAARIGAHWYFISYAGAVQPISVSGEPVPESRWWLTSEQERMGKWRPAGWHWTAGRDDGRLFVAMTPNGYPGSHKDPAAEVWVFDVAKQERLARIPLVTAAISIEVTADASPRLVVANADGAVDVYDIANGKHLTTLYDVGETPYMIHRID
jgi:methylamine dehydrogenase heavy chain